MLQKEVMIVFKQENHCTISPSNKKKNEKKKTNNLNQDRMNSFYLMRHLKRLCCPILDVSIIYMVQLFLSLFIFLFFLVYLSLT